MRILHTADWHMNDTLGRISRGKDIVRALEQIAAYLETEKIDVMLVAGDLFRERSDRDEMREAVGEIKRLFEPFLRRGGAMVAISGNHDSEVFFETLDDALSLAAAERPGPNGADATGRLHVASRSRVLRLADPAGQKVQFVLMPYPTGRYLLDRQRHFKTVAERNSELYQTYLRVLERRAGELEERLPAVLATHIHVRGAETHNLYRITEQEDVVFNASDIPAHWAYVACGHIHKPQPAVRGACHIRYSGSIERLDRGERGDNKSVVVIEIGPEGLRGEPALLPLDSTPIAEIVLGADGNPIADLERHETHYGAHPDRERMLVHYTLHWRQGEHNLEAIRARLHALFPRWYDCDLKPLRAEGSGPGFEALDLAKTHENILDYLDRQLEKDPQRDILLELARELLAEDRAAGEQTIASIGVGTEMRREASER